MDDEGMETAPSEPLWAAVLFVIVAVLMAAFVVVGLATGGWPLS